MASYAQLLVALASVAAASPLAVRNPPAPVWDPTNCNGITSPPWSDCDSAYGQLLQTYFYGDNTYEATFTPGSGAGGWGWQMATSGNCTVGLGWLGPQSFPGQYLSDGYNDLKDTCSNMYGSPGGSINSNVDATEVNMAVSASLAQTGPSSKRSDDEGFKQLRRRASFSVFSTGQNVQNEDQRQAVPGTSALSAGGSWTLTTTNTVETSWTANIDISDDFGDSLLGSISADIGFSYTYDETVSSSIAQSISNSCSGEGTLYYQPLSTFIQGDFTDDTGYVHSNVQIWIPQTADSGLEQGQYQVQCAN